MSSIQAQSDLNRLQNNTNQVHYQNSRKNLGSDRIDREGFIRLMLAQLQYQDPTEPKDNAQMLTQQLQLEQADQMNSIVDATKFSQASSMIGKTAQLFDAPWNFETGISGTPEWDVDTNSPKTVTGVIESVQFDKSHGKALVKINGTYYDADKILNLFENSTVNAGHISNVGGLVGKTASLVDAPWDAATQSFRIPLLDPNTGLPQVTTGRVDSIKLDPNSGQTLIEINGKYYNAEGVQRLLSAVGN
jgi:flagellar basal-body rod modification protein FlgD